MTTTFVDTTDTGKVIHLGRIWAVLVLLIAIACTSWQLGVIAGLSWWSDFTLTLTENGHDYGGNGDEHRPY